MSVAPSCAHTHILLLGLDGGSPELLLYLAEIGAMPFLRSLVARQPLCKLDSIPPYATPPAWATIYTGVSPGHHGVLDFRDLTEVGDRLVNRLSMRSVPLWQRLSAHGRRVAMIAFPLTYPPPPLNGVVLCGLPAPRDRALWSYPEGLGALLEAVPGLVIDPEFTSPGTSLQQTIEQSKQHVWAITQAALLAHTHYGADGWDLFGVQFQALDAFQHMFWAWVDPNDLRFASRPTAERQLALSFYHTLDDAIQCLVEALRPREIILLSDHGFGPAYEAVCLNLLLLEVGLLKLKTSLSSLRFILAAQRLLKQLDVFNLRARLKFSVRPNAVLAGLDQLRRDRLIDYDASAAFAFSGGYCGLIKIKPGFESTVRQELLSARHPVKRTPLIKSVQLVSELWDGPWAKAWQQYAVVQPEDGYLIDTHFRPYGVVAPVSAGLTGTHRPTGLLWTTLESLQNVGSILGIAPGILQALGLPNNTLNCVEKDTGATLFSPQEQAAIEERLRKLGYL